MRYFSSQIFLAVTLLILICAGFCQDGITASQPLQSSRAPRPAAAGVAPIVISLDEAIRRAEQNEPNFANAVAAKGIAAQDRLIARAGLLPDVRYHNEYIYTQSSGVKNASGETGGSNPFVFIANNAIHEYASQATITETLGLAGIAQVKRANAASAQATALAEVARRGLVFTVVQQYYGVLAAGQKLRVAQRAAREADRFVDLTRKLEQGREVAHADVVKAELQLEQRQRDLENTQLLAENARLELGILLFPDPQTSYTLADGEAQAPPVPARADVDAAAKRNNPEVRSAMEALRVAGEDVSIARAAYFPDLSLNWTYGIDAPQFATYGLLDTSLSPEVKPRNLGYSAFVSLDIPVWDWFATHDRVKQSELRKSAAKTALSFTQKRLLANLDEYYHEAEIAGRQVVSLKQSVQTATDSLKLTNLRYQAGEATVLEVVDAQNALSLAETAYADGTVRYRAALANLQTLTGTLP